MQKASTERHKTMWSGSGKKSMNGNDKKTLAMSSGDNKRINEIIAHTAAYYNLDQMKRQKHALDMLNRTSKALLDRYGEDEILDKVVEGIRAIGFDRVRIYLLSADRLLLTGRAGFEVTDGFVSASWLLSEDHHMQKLIRDPMAQVFNYQNGSPGHHENDLNKEGVEEWAAVPMMAYGEIIGQVAADNK